MTPVKVDGPKIKVGNVFEYLDGSTRQRIKRVKKKKNLSNLNKLIF